MHFLRAFFLSFLPPRYRRAAAGRGRAPKHDSNTYLIAAAGVSGFFEMVVFGTIYIAGFVAYTDRAVIGPAAFLEYFFYPPAWLLALFLFDGGLRLLASLAGQALGSIPLYFVVWIHGWFERRSANRRLGPLIADLVERGDGSRYELRISSCRPRANWDKWMTVMYEEKLYEIAAAELGQPPRPYVYLLRTKPESKVIRGLHRYHPDEVFSLED
jgi:hypothetical protein